MNRRKGSMTLCLLLLFSMLVTLSAGALYYVSRTASEAYLYQQGLSSVYAAESGANVALGRLKAGAMGNQSFTLSVNGRRVKVTDTPTSSREGSSCLRHRMRMAGTSGRCGSRTRAKSMRDNASPLLQTCRADWWLRDWEISAPLSFLPPLSYPPLWGIFP